MYMRDVKKPMNNPSETLQELDSWAHVMEVTLEFVQINAALFSCPL